MTITLAVKSKDTVWFGADTRAHVKDTLHGYQHVPGPQRKIIPLQSVSDDASPSLRNAAVTYAGTHEPTLLKGMVQVGALAEPNRTTPWLLAQCSSADKNKQIDELGTMYMCAGFEPDGLPFVSRTTLRTKTLTFACGDDWQPHFGDEKFGVDINGIDEVVDWLFRASGQDLIKLYRNFLRSGHSEEDREFVCAFSRTLRDYKEHDVSWDSLRSSEVAAIIRGILRVTSILNCLGDIRSIVSNRRPNTPITYSGPPFELGTIRREQGFEWYGSLEPDSEK